MWFRGGAQGGMGGICPPSLYVKKGPESKCRLFSIFWCGSKFKIKNCLHMLWTFYTSTISHFPSHEKLQSAGAIGAVTLTVNIPPVAGKLPKFNIVEMLMSPPYPGGPGNVFCCVLIPIIINHNKSSLFCASVLLITMWGPLMWTLPKFRMFRIFLNINSISYSFRSIANQNGVRYSDSTSYF
jgi:hypothetical protein